MTMRAAVQSFSSKHVLLLGDTIIDIYTYGTAIGLSSETPTIVGRKESTKRSLGGAGFVCANLLALGAKVTFVTLAGSDEESRYIRDFERPNLTLIPIPDQNRPTTVKHRFWMDGYKLFQLDTRDDTSISDGLAQRVMSEVAPLVLQCDAVVISDYRHGFLTPRLASLVMQSAQRAGKDVYVDSQVAQRVSNHLQYRPGAIMCLNLKEARCLDPHFSPGRNPDTFANLMGLLETDRIVVKLGGEGALMLHGNEVVAAPAHPARMVDPTGAGDAFLSAFVLAGTTSAATALALANIWAGLSVEIHGTTPPELSALTALLET